MNLSKYSIPINANISDDYLSNVFEEENIDLFPNTPQHNPVFFPEVPKYTIVIFPKVPTTIIYQNTLITYLSKYLCVSEYHIRFNTNEFRKKLFDKKLTLLVTKNNNELEILNKYIKNINYFIIKYT